jgi:hypothetical protein
MSVLSGLVGAVPNLTKSGIQSESGDDNSASVKSQIPQCQVIWFPWITPDSDVYPTPDVVDPSDLSRTSSYDISKHLLSCSFSKEKSQPAGSFTLKLDNSRDWKDFIKPGEWMLILMTQDGDLFKDDSQQENIATLPRAAGGNVEFVTAPDNIQTDKVRGIVYVERVAVSVDTGPDGQFIANYEISGKDFGIIYEATELWYSIFLNEIPVLNGLHSYLKEQPNASVTNLIAISHDLYFGTENPLRPLTATFSKQVDLETQWLLPKTLVKLLNQNPNTDPYYGNLPNLLKLDDTPATIPLINPIPMIGSTNAWQKLKEFSLEPLHELFCETGDDGQMHLYFRAIPWSKDTSGYPNLNHIKKFQELANDANTSVEIFPRELISLSLGEDNHYRYNHFMFIAQPSYIQGTTDITQLLQPTPKGRTFPLQNRPSVARHGFRPMHARIDAFFSGFTDGKKDALKNSPTASTPLTQFNEVLYDYWSNFVFFESGSLTLFGNNKVKVGKVLKLGKDFPYNPDSFYYIEGYSDDFTVGENGASEWKQTVYVTHGVEASDLDEGSRTSGFSRKSRPFTKDGTFIKRG